MRAALEGCGEFLSHIGALDSANAIAEILHKTGVELSDTSSFRWRALFAAIRKELDAEPMDIVFLYERMLQLDVMMLRGLSHALFGSPLFLHLLVERLAVAFEGLDAELFKLESDELCHAEGIYETCVVLRDKIEESQSDSELATFLETFKRIFEQDEPKDYWDAFYEHYHLNISAFRRDMKRALSMIESIALGPTKLELAFPTKAADSQKKVVPRALLEKKFGGTRREWQKLSQITTITGCGFNHVTDNEQAQQEQEEEEETQILANTVNGETTESAHSDVSNEALSPEQPVSSRPPRAAEVARGTCQEGRRAALRTRVRGEQCGTTKPRSISRLPGRRKRVRWSAEEEAALIEGYRLYANYSNVWMLIKSKFPVVLQNRSNVDLKDKYRNLLRYGLTNTSHGNDNARVTDNVATDDDTDAVAYEKEHE
ncbi:unnamed protein product [Peronospora belbahrii]|uniref:Myb-like domain-containing protein n=1 Tax=Peronospora belbahrii TaxID=622444 RepID=A0AAU9L5I2_9STRA|nr:unnamed protein product [Peronospora belbahrii]